MLEMGDLKCGVSGASCDFLGEGAFLRDVWVGLMQGAFNSLLGRKEEG
jgi:hypothetical protein